MLRLERQALAALALLLAFVIGTAHAGEVPIAVAANFASPMKRIAADFEKDTGHKVVAAFGSTGKLYAQIRNGAPFEVFVAADAKTPAKLVAEHAADGSTRFTYALGKLVLWSARPDMVDDHGAVLGHGRFEKLAIANPKLAPYGAAAVEVMRALGVLDALQPKLVTGENIGQTFQFVATGNAPLGFVALAQVMKNGKIGSGSGWIVAPTLYTPIRQDAVLLHRGKGNPAAAALLKYLRSENARSVIRAYGYDF